MMTIKMAMIMMINDLEIVEGAEPIKHLPQLAVDRREMITV